MFCRPRLLICDEPTSALDPVGRRELLDILVNVKEQTTVLFSTHILSDVEHICDEIAFLHEGNIVLQGPLEKVRRKRRDTGVELELARTEEVKFLLSEFPFLELSGSNRILLKEAKKLPDVLRLIADRNLAILRLERQEAALEDLFLEVVGK